MAYTGNLDIADLQVSHLCHVSLCVCIDHLSLEPGYINNSRKPCQSIGHCIGGDVIFRLRIPPLAVNVILSVVWARLLPRRLPYSLGQLLFHFLAPGFDSVRVFREWNTCCQSLHCNGEPSAIVVGAECRDYPPSQCAETGSRLQQFEDSAACSVDKLYKNHAKKNLTDFDVITKLRCGNPTTINNEPLTFGDAGWDVGFIAENLRTPNIVRTAEDRRLEKHTHALPA
ncbi:hypothetical protein Bbelb_302740 [Branchiostoma belcheri]|nr:hypothetical protein Bbelb_302740 [Branchiostoma belcheri]